MFYSFGIDVSGNKEIDHRLSPPGGSYQHKRALASLSRLGNRKYNFYVTVFFMWNALNSAVVSLRNLFPVVRTVVIHSECKGNFPIHQQFRVLCFFLIQLSLPFRDGADQEVKPKDFNVNVGRRSDSDPDEEYSNDLLSPQL